MAQKITSINTYRKKDKKKNPGVHSKTKQSANKNADNYKKPYNKQGK